MHTHRPSVFSVLLACAAAALLATAARASQAPASSASTQASSQPVTLTGCIEYGPRDTYVLATKDIPEHPDLSNEPALERQELASAEHSYQLIPTTGEHFSQLVGAKVRADGKVSRVASQATAPAARGNAGRGAIAPAPIDELNVSSVQKLAPSCGAQPTMFAM